MREIYMQIELTSGTIRNSGKRTGQTRLWIQVHRTYVFSFARRSRELILSPIKFSRRSALYSGTSHAFSLAFETHVYPPRYVNLSRVPSSTSRTCALAAVICTFLLNSVHEFNLALSSAIVIGNARPTLPFRYKQVWRIVDHSDCLISNYNICAW